jgi:electron transport complex protein RnfC
MLSKLFRKTNETRGLQIKPKLNAASLDIVKLDNINTLVYPLEDAKFNTYIPTVNVGDKVSKEQVIANAENAHGLKILAAADGIIKAIEVVKAPLPQKTTTAIIIEPENKQYIFEDVMFNMDVHIADYPSEMIFQKTVQANIQGLGGGLFLAAKKMQATTVKHVIINAVECEPVLNCDEAVLTHYLAESLFGGLLIQKAVQADNITIVLKENKTQLIEHISHFVENNEMFKNIEVVTVPDLYPAGAEKEILKHCFNIDLQSKDIAVEKGFLMQNAMTCISIFRAVTADLKQLERIYSVFGKDIKDPKNVLAPIGATAEDILKFLKLDSSQVNSIRVGGLMMGEDIIDDNSIKHTALLKSSNGIILNTAEKLNVTDCINCGECVKVCPVDLAPHKMFKAADNDDFENVYLDRLADCMNCNLCNYVCPSNIDLVGMFKYAKQQVHLIEEEKKRAEYINELTRKKRERTKAEEQEKERIKQERKLAREKRLAAKKAKEQEDATTNS